MRQLKLPGRKALAAALLLPASWIAFCAPLPAQSGAAKSTKSVVVPTSEEQKQNYVIGAGDVLQINVLREPDASVASVTVRSDGVISIPLLKEVPAGGLTPRQLEQRITRGLAALIREPDVTVIVREIHSERFFVIGAVRREGAMPFTGPCTILQALAQAGGFTDYAKKSKVYVLRDINGQQKRIPFNYASVIRGEHPEQNIELLPGDTVVVP